MSDGPIYSMLSGKWSPADPQNYEFRWNQQDTYYGTAWEYNNPLTCGDITIGAYAAVVQAAWGPSLSSSPGWAFVFEIVEHKALTLYTPDYDHLGYVNFKTRTVKVGVSADTTEDYSPLTFTTISSSVSTPNPLVWPNGINCEETKSTLISFYNNNSSTLSSTCIGTLFHLFYNGDNYQHHEAMYETCGNF
jgi:hypothetical protein